MDTEKIEGTPKHILEALEESRPGVVGVSKPFVAVFEARIGSTVIYKVAKSIEDVPQVMKTFISMVRMEVKDLEIPPSEPSDP